MRFFSQPGRKCWIYGRMKERYFWWYAILCFFLTPRLFPNVITLHKNNPRFFRFCFIIVAPFLNFLLKCCPLKLVCIYLMANWPFFLFFIGDQKRRKKQRQVKETVVVFFKTKKRGKLYGLRDRTEPIPDANINEVVVVVVCRQVWWVVESVTAVVSGLDDSKFWAIRHNTSSLSSSPSYLNNLPFFLKSPSIDFHPSLSNRFANHPKVLVSRFICDCRGWLDWHNLLAACRLRVERRLTRQTFLQVDVIQQRHWMAPALKHLSVSVAEERETHFTFKLTGNLEIILSRCTFEM